MVGRPTDLATILAALNTAGVTGVLVVILWLGLRGDIVLGTALSECQATRDYFVREYLRHVREPEK